MTPSKLRNVERPVRAAIGRNIRRHRRRLGLYGHELGGRLGVEKQTVCHYETGKTMPPMIRLLAMCDLFGVSLDELVGRAPAKGAA